MLTPEQKAALAAQYEEAEKARTLKTQIDDTARELAYTIEARAHAAWLATAPAERKPQRDGVEYLEEARWRITGALQRLTGDLSLEVALATALAEERLALDAPRPPADAPADAPAEDSAPTTPDETDHQ